jgi:BirA family biotin operon repressor/biotin-[acetyl-CoA-carboxylase] ligase
MKLKYLKEVDSTQTYIKEYIKQNNEISNICFYTYNQTSGLGSQNNIWEGEKGNLFFSFSVFLENLPVDLPLQSASIYFSYILKEVLAELGSNVILKWPNDFYIDTNKIGGVITNKINKRLICGIGLNLNKTLSFDGKLDIYIDKELLLKKYFDKLENYISWKQIFSKYKLEFHHNKLFYTNINNVKISLENAILNDDGSLTINNKKVYSLR